MSELKFNQRKIETLIQKVFPHSSVKDYKRFSEGLVNPTFKIQISNPSKKLVVKLGRMKNKLSIQKNNFILNYLNANGLPSPKIYYEGVLDMKYITVMDLSPGTNATSIYKNANHKMKEKILLNAGRTLRRIHELKIPNFWTHQYHEIKDDREWKAWTKQRIKKYLKFFKSKLRDYYPFIEKELWEFWNVLENERMEFVPLHWDYHLSNLNADSKGKITGIFDFDNAMKGHNLADLGQTEYWIIFGVDDFKNFQHFLKGYKEVYSKKDLVMIRGYFILHLLAVSRSIWFKQKRLGWIIEKHMGILNELAKGKL